MGANSNAGRRLVRRSPEAVGIGSLFLALFAVHGWSVLVGTVGYRGLDGLVAGNRYVALLLPVVLLYVVGTALGAWGYARARSVEIPVGLPERRHLPTVLAVASTPPLLVAAVALAGNGLLDTTVSAMQQVRYSPEVQVRFLVAVSLVPAALRGVAYGFLFFGVVHERLRSLTTPRHALVLTPVVAGFFRVVSEGSVSMTRVDPGQLLLLVVAVVASAAFGASLGLLYRAAVLDSLEDVLRPAYAPVFAVGLVGLVGVAMELGEFPSGVVHALWVVVLGVGAYGYERTRSVWVPAAVAATFPVALDAAAVLEATFGLTPPL